MNPSREVVITGMGLVSPIGIGREAFWQSLTDGASGVAMLPVFEGTKMPVPFGAALKDFDPKLYVKPRKAMKVMCREIQAAFAAAAMAADDAGLDQSAVDPDRVGSVFGSQMLYGDIHDVEDVYRSCMVDGDFDFSKFGEQFPTRIYPLWMLMNLPNMAACHVAIARDARGPNNTIVSGDASSMLAVIEAARVIRRSAADVMIVGGMGTRICLTGWMYRGDINLSHRIENPAAASRPFDLHRDGMVNGEGAGTIILESREHAVARGAEVLGTIAGWGESFDSGAEGTTSRRAAIGRAIDMALRSGDLSAESIGHVNAHGLSTIESDRAEASAIDQQLGQVPVTALKSYFGNLGAGGGMVELIGSLIGLQQGVIPRTLNYETPDPACPINVVHGEVAGSSRPSFIKLSHSAMGQTAAVIVTR